MDLSLLESLFSNEKILLISFLLSLDVNSVFYIYIEV